MVGISTPETSFEDLPLRLAYGFLEANGAAKESDIIRESRESLGSYTTSLKRAKIVSLLRSRGLLDRFIQTNWSFALTPDGRKKLSRYDQIFLRYEKSGGTEVGDAGPRNEDPEASSEFAFEEQLRDYLADNLGILEGGLTLWPVENGDAVEFQLEEAGRSRRIDILAKDHSGAPVVVELKVSRGHERTIGQALYYRARVKQRFRVDRVRIFIVAAQISSELRAAATEISDISLWEYSLAVKVTQVCP